MWKEKETTRDENYISQILIPSQSLKLRTAERTFMILNFLTIPVYEFQKYSLSILTKHDYLASMLSVYWPQIINNNNKTLETAKRTNKSSPPPPPAIWRVCE